MALSVEEGKALVTEFCAQYHLAYQVQYQLRSRQEDIFSEQATIEAVGKIYGAYFPSRNLAAFATSNFRDQDEFKGTLRHEILGHFGINTFTEDEKQRLLTAIVEAKDSPDIAPLWQKIDRAYTDKPDFFKAEELYAFICEDIDPQQPVNILQARDAFQDVCLDRSRPLTMYDLKNITSMVADGMRDGSRKQQIFPLTDTAQFKRDTSMEKKKPFHEIVAENLIKQLEAGTAPWQKPWEPGEFNNGLLPVNPTTGNRYKGVNALQLMAQDRQDNRWMTYKQASAMDAQVRKGEKGTPIQYWKFSEEQNKVGEDGKPVLDDNGKPVTVNVRLERPRGFMAIVFNAEQIDGLPQQEKKEKVLSSWEIQERAEKILAASGADIRNIEGDRAFYRPSTDTIQLPERNQFSSADKYYATALHELGHWTGHPSRLDRDLANPFGSVGYAKEELRAEIASMILGEELGVGHDPEQHAAYVRSWIKVLKEEPMEIFRAAADAEKIQDYVLSLEQKQTIKNELTDYQTQALSFLNKNYSIQELSQEHLEFLNNSYSQGSAPVVGAMELAESFKFQFNDHGFTFAVADSLTHHRDNIFNDQSLSYLDAGFDSQKGMNKFIFNASDSPYKHVVGVDFKNNTAEILETISKADNESLEPSQSQFISDVKGLSAVTLGNAWLTRHVENHSAQETQDIMASYLEHDILEVLNHPDVNFDHFESFQGESLESALRDQGFNTIGSVTGVDPQKYNETALERLSPVFGISVDHDKTDNSYLERKGLAQHFWVVAEDLHLKHIAKELEQTPTLEAKEAPMAVNTPTDAEIAAILADDDLQARIAAEEAFIKQRKQEEQAPQARVYLVVPYKEKDDAKALGAKWDRQEMSWYVPPGTDPEPFQKWSQKASLEASSDSMQQPAPVVQQTPPAAAKVPQERVYLAVPYSERQAAKEAGALWDKQAKSWYAGPNADQTKLVQWAPEKVQAQDPAKTPHEEFADALRSVGCVVTGEHPIMDGKKHRIATEGDKPGEKAGFYVGHLDGHPAGFIQNNKTSQSMKWKSKGYTLSEEEKAKLNAEAATKLAARAAELEKTQETTAKRVNKRLGSLTPITPDAGKTPYLDQKGVGVHSGAFTDKDGQKTYIPAYDVNGKVWTMQYISEDGAKRFAKNSKKEGCFHVVGGLDALAKAPALVVSEGYVTAITITEALGFATVAAFDSGNLPRVVKALHEKFPDKPVLVVGDDDRHLEMTQGRNAGRIKAVEAANQVNGKAIFPIFTPREQIYPANLESVTPEKYRNKKLSEEQLSALDTIKMFTDFNDMTTKSELGHEGAERQLKSAYSKVMNEHQVHSRKRQLGQRIDEEEQPKQKKAAHI